MRTSILLLLLAALPTASSQPALLLKPDRVFDGQSMHEGWSVLVRGDVIEAVGRDVTDPQAEIRELPGTTLLPGLIEGHSHVLLHPYDEASWNDQVLVESLPERVARALNHSKSSLSAGWTTMRDLGSEGAGYADVQIARLITRGLAPGPRLLVAGPAIVATGSYGPKGFREDMHVPLGAVEADGSGLISETRRQMGGGADWVKIYADYRVGPNGEALPTFSEEEITAVVRTAADAGRDVSAHSGTAEGMLRATRAGVRTIEHGDGGTPEVWREMAARGTWLCPTLAAVDASERYRGWDGSEPAPARVQQKRLAFGAALAAGVPMCVGSDVGVFTHGTQVRELELMVEGGMSTTDVLIAATSGNAAMLRMEGRIGSIKPGLDADLVVVHGNPIRDISALQNVELVLQRGRAVDL